MRADGGSERGNGASPAVKKHDTATFEQPVKSGTAHPRYEMTKMLCYTAIRVVPRLSLAPMSGVGYIFYFGGFSWQQKSTA